MDCLLLVNRIIQGMVSAPHDGLTVPSLVELDIWDTRAAGWNSTVVGYPSTVAKRRSDGEKLGCKMAVAIFLHMSVCSVSSSASIPFQMAQKQPQ